jgi:hypothetical protein
MTLYVGELTKIVHTATKDGEALLPADVTNVWITLYTSTLEVLVAETTMSWDSAQARWQYLWDTDGLDPGTYRARVRIEGVDGGSVWEYRRIRLARNPVDLDA